MSSICVTVADTAFVCPVVPLPASGTAEGVGADSGGVSSGAWVTISRPGGGLAVSGDPGAWTRRRSAPPADSAPPAAAIPLIGLNPCASRALLGSAIGPGCAPPEAAAVTTDPAPLPDGPV